MPKRKQPDSMQLMVARALFRTDKWDPSRDMAEPFEWDELRTTYLQKSGRLIRTLEKDGLQIAAKIDQPESDAA